MIQIIFAVFLRIISNPIANAAQKAISGQFSASFINFSSYFIMSFCLIPYAIKINWTQYSNAFWMYVLLAGFLCALGTYCLIKALSIGELSIIAPINAYKCVIGLVSGLIILNEIPNFISILGLVFIVLGSKEIFKNTKAGFSFRLFKEEYFRLRIYALILTGIEASFLKKIILLSNPMTSFVLWAFTGMLFSSVFFFFSSKKLNMLKIQKPYILCKNIIQTIKNIGIILLIPLALSTMQLSTNFVFEKIEVSLALALFQLSSIVSLIFGIIFFKERNIKQKIIGTGLMIIGAAIILVN